MYEDDREEEISQSDAEPVKKATINETSTSFERRDYTDLKSRREKSVMTMNTPVQNADDVPELVFAVVPNSARYSFDGTSGTITDALLHDERVIAARN